MGASAGVRQGNSARLYLNALQQTVAGQGRFECELAVHHWPLR
jgi:hypothetical protein